MTMMFGYDRDVSGWGWFVMSASIILLWALIIAIAVLLNRSHEHGKAHATPSAEDILDERLARGEMSHRRRRGSGAERQSPCRTQPTGTVRRRHHPE
ncbi:SHOCT domain-containing protein [Streptomyces longwoodensis]|uniref:SHOCT domain-containing protein n=1 Tax=Streptomyces longwoodensis TaxID=68231 RepID=UPI0033C3CDCE